MTEDYVDPLLCPLCQQTNQCINLGSADINKSCWCNDPEISFPQALLDQVPKEKKRKACICKECAKAFEGKLSVQICNPLKSNNE